MGKEVRTFAVATSLAALAALTGCDEVAHTQLNFSATEKVAITEISVTGGGSGDITVRGTGPTGEVRIDRVVRYRGDEPSKTYRLAGSVLHLDTDCGSFCRVSYDIQAPPGVAVRGESGSGDVILTDIAAINMRLGSGSIAVSDSSADVTVHTGSGDITASAVAGALTAETGSGTIEARGVRHGPTRVRTGSGDMTIALVEPADVRARAGSGDINVSVPAGRYRVQANTGSGDTNLGVPNDAAAEHLLEFDSGSGDITLVTG